MNWIDIKKTVVFLGLIFFLCIKFQIAGAGDDKPRNARIEIDKITLFKNGLGFIVSTATLPGDASEVRIGQLPIPSFGTFWVAYPKNVKLQTLVTSMEEQEQNVPAQSIGQLLRLNAGRKVVVHIGDRDIEGTVLTGPAEENSHEVPSPYFMSTQRVQDPYGRYLPEILTGELLLIKTEKGTTAINQNSIQRAEFSDGAPVSTTHVTQRKPSIRIKLEKPVSDGQITVSYLARGITWAPSYLIDLSDPKTAKFSAHAMIINEMTDLKNVKLQLATGFPNIKFGEILNPIAKSQSLAEFLGALSGSPGRQSGAGYMTQQAVMLSNVASYEVEAPSLVPNYSTATEGSVAEDLFFYPVKDFTLNKNETAWLPLFTAEMPYKHVYTWKIEDFIDREERYRSDRESQGQKNAEEIWHSCRLTNNMNMPLTTAATEFITNGEFTGQDVCYYTPPKGETTIRINKALNVLAEQAEIEVERKRDAYSFHGYRYDLVKVRGELRIKNKLVKSISIEITKALSGEILESTPKAKDVKTAKGLKQVNSNHILKWEIELSSGEEQKLSYQYQVYIRE
jgi:hypothetical protein